METATRRNTYLPELDFAVSLWLFMFFLAGIAPMLMGIYSPFQDIAGGSISATVLVGFLLPFPD